MQGGVFGARGGIFGARGGSRPDNPNKRPLLWRRFGGAWAAFFARAGRQGGYAYGRAGKTVCVGANGEVGIVDQATGVLTECTGALKVCGNVAQTLGTAPWAHSSGALFVTAKPTADAGSSLYRSTDPLLGWTKVLDIVADLGPATATGDKVVQMTELPSGWILACTYGTNDPPDSNNASAIIRSKDAGITWQKLASFDRLAYAPRHMHFIVYDRYRDLVWAGGGDGLAASKICYSRDGGDTWTAWPATWQCTGLLPLPRGVILISDHNSQSYRLHRIPGATLGELLAQAFTTADHVAYDPVAQHPVRAGIVPALKRDEAGFSWWGWHDDLLGVSYAAFNSIPDATGRNQEFEGVLAASGSEDGAGDCPAWQPVDWDKGSWGGNNAQASPPNPYDAGWDRWHYTASDTDNGAPAAWRVVPPDFVIHVHQAAGTPWGRGTAADPISWWPDEALPPARRIRLLADFAGPVRLGNAGTVVERNGFTLGTAVAGTLDVDETFSASASAPANWSAEVVSSGAVTWNDTTRAVDGTYAVKCAVTTSSTSAARARRLGTGLAALAEGQDTWLRFRYWLDEAALAAVCNVAEWVNQGAVQLRSQTDKAGAAHVVLAYLSQDAIVYYGDPWAPVDFPLQQWVDVVLRCRASQGAGGVYGGELDAWINGRQALAVRGVKTWGGTSFNSASVGLTNKAAAAAARAAWVDKVQIAHGANAFDPRKPTAAQLYGTGQRLLPEGIDS